MWTLEGLGSLDVALVRELMKSPDPQIRIQAIRASETLYKGRRQILRRRLPGDDEDPDPNVVIQAMLTLNLHKVPDSAERHSRDRGGEPIRGVKEIGSADPASRRRRWGRGRRSPMRAPAS